MNRKQYQKDKNRFDYLNKKLYRAAQGELSKMSQQLWLPYRDPVGTAKNK